MKQISGEDIKNLIQAFESLSREILESTSTKSYREIFNFFKSYLNPKQVYFWRLKEVHNKEKKKFLSLNKASLEDFEKIYTNYNGIEFDKSSYKIIGTNLYFRLPILEGSDFYCLSFEGVKQEVLKNELALHFFSQRLNGIFHLIEKIESIQNLNYVDDVTGLYNQRYLGIVLDQEIERNKRSDDPFCVLFIDIDHFKSVNDKNGHLVGSKILKEIGSILLNSVRTVDYCFRYGGDEFLVILTKTQTEQALQVAERICQTIRETPFIVNGQHIQVTISIGVANFPDHAKTKEKILHVADEAMYCGKRFSRNIVYLAG